MARGQCGVGCGKAGPHFVLVDNQLGSSLWPMRKRSEYEIEPDVANHGQSGGSWSQIWPIVVADAGKFLPTV